MHALRRQIVKSHLRSMARRGRPVGPGMAIFLDDFIGEKILLDGGFDLEELRSLERSVFPHVRKGTVCLDIGANIGNHARFFARFFPRVYAFEPHPRIFGLLSANAYGQGIVALNYGLSDRAGRLAVEENRENLGASRISDGAGSGPEYEVRRLDDVVGDLVQGDIGFVKLDVEGHETQAIRGARATLMKHRPIVTFEVLSETVFDGEPEAVSELRSIGYTSFYRMESRAAWKRIKTGVIARAARSLRRLLFPHNLDRIQLVPFDKISADEPYAVLVASFFPL
jgi:FkbM family methyltransferase